MIKIIEASVLPIMDKMLKEHHLRKINDTLQELKFGCGCYLVKILDSRLGLVKIALCSEHEENFSKNYSPTSLVSLEPDDFNINSINTVFCKITGES